ncbi:MULTISPECIES: STAS domain-containing protein [unclassified Mycobacterium]|uniref:STAS domain-containing protein n=1 Tax=unclassified Mycobacterium TaxID=2642494 RepID=UPI0006DD1D39|nr:MULTISPECIES: STAS domain-containing protein [unclassified Mycobacterium]OBG60843.1 sulfate transporter [Mycobacterium sp. E3339]OBH88016.1 sulfate transporter [Mycobacterium sp. E2989]
MTAQPFRAEERLDCYEIDCAGARLHVRVHGVATVLRVEGEIDASNADLVAQAARRFVRLRVPLILDVSLVDYLGSAGLRALLLVDDECRLARLHCSVVGGEALHRLTRLVTGLRLPLVDSVADALELIRGTIRG